MPSLEGLAHGGGVLGVVLVEVEDHVVGSVRGPCFPAFAGIAGDRQHINGLSGLNVHLLEEGKKRGYIEEMPGSLIPSGHLKTQLFLTTDPYIRGISGNEEGVAKLLEDAGIDQSKTYMDLTDEEKRKLSSLIAIRLTQQGMLECSLNEIARTRYYLTGFKMDA